jgi:hypothetical protein
LANIVFLDKVGETLRQVASDITREELPEDIQLLLRRLERLERLWCRLADAQAFATTRRSQGARS